MMRRISPDTIRVNDIVVLEAFVIRRDGSEQTPAAFQLQSIALLSPGPRSDAGIDGDEMMV